MYQDIQTSLDSMFPTFDQRIEASISNCDVLNQSFNQSNYIDKKLMFSQQDESLEYANMGYEERIYHKGIIATRTGNWHDFFNAMVWHNFAKIKIAINAIHIQELHQQKDNNRSRKRDLLTLFDECGVIIIAKTRHLDMIRQHKWQELFVENKALWLSGDIKIITFGHAMFEKYLNPYIGMTAQALLCESMHESSDEFIADGILKRKLLLSKAELAPLPVLGIPGWHAIQDLSLIHI